MASKKSGSKKSSGETGSSSAGRGKQGVGAAAPTEKASNTARKRRVANSRTAGIEAGESTFKSQSPGNAARAKPASSAYGKDLSPTKSGASTNRGSVLAPTAAQRGARLKETGADVVVRSFEPDRGVVVLEFKRRRERYTRERLPGQVVAMADYLRARRGFSSDQEMAEILQVHRTRLAAWKQGAEVPNPQNAQLLSYLAVVVNELEEFLDPDVIPDWLVTEQYTLGGETPVQALREGQLAEVLQAANATEHGSYV